jgi:putative transferase (TIGR04331 family)
MRLIHFTGLENYLDCSKFENTILSPNINDDYTNHLNKKIYYLSNNWQKNKIRIKKKVIKLRVKLLLQLTKELNSINKINFTTKDWEILLEPWLHTYLASNYFRWLIVSELITIYKKFSYLEIKVKKKIPIFDTLQFYEFDHNDDTYNHLMFQSILQFQNEKKKILTKKTLKKKIFYLDNKFMYKIYTKTKNNFVFILYEKFILNFVNIKMLINIRTKKINFFKLCLKLNILGFKGLSIFDRKKLINISNMNSYEATKRENLKLIPNNKSDFENYIFKKIKEDIPRVFIENFKDIKKLHEKKLTKIDMVVSDTHHRYNPIFKSWIAHRKNLDKSFKIITADHGGMYGAKSIYNYNNAISSVVFKHQKKVLNNQISLPCLFLNKNKNISNDKIMIICKDIPKYPRHFLNGPMCEEIISEFKQVQKFIENSNADIRKKIIIRPYRRTGWQLDKKYKKIVGKKNMIYSNKDYNKLRDDAIIRIVNYPQTAFLESIINGPTFLLFNKKLYYESKYNEKFMNILFKNKIAFESGRDLSTHLNKINSNILDWWNQKKIKDSINIFMDNINIYDEDPIKSWARNIKKISNSKFLK